MKKISKQRRWQLKMREQGRCYICGVDTGGPSRCEDHSYASSGVGEILYDTSRRKAASRKETR